MLIRRRSLLAAGAALALAPRMVRAREPGTLVFGLSSYPPSLQPWLNAGTAAIAVKVQMFRGLTSYGSDGKVRPELAESWEQVGDTGWKFRLREAYFHNGARVTAEDVHWTMEQVTDEKSTALFAAQFRDIDRIETPDPATVILWMKGPSIMVPEWLAHPHMPIIAKGSTDNDGPGIGAGPYRMKAMERGVSVEMEAFDKFYRPGLPKTRTLRFIAYADENLRVAALQAGDVDIIEYVPWQAMSTIEADPSLKLDSKNGPFMWLAFNGGKKPFDNPLVRQACAYAVKREEIVQAAFFGRGAPLGGLPITPDSPFYDATRANHWSYDPDKAKALLKQAGLADGFETTLLSTAQYGMHKSTAEVVQQNLADIGIQAQLNMPDWATRVSLGQKGQYDFAIQGSTADNNDPDGLATLVNGSLPLSNARSVNLPTPEIDALFAKGRAEFDPAKRKEIYAELETKALEQCSFVGLAWRSQGYAMAKAVTGFVGLPGGLSFYSTYSIEDTAIG